MQFSPPGQLSTLCHIRQICVLVVKHESSVLNVSNLAYCKNIQLRCVLLEDETNLSSKGKVYFTVLNIMMILPRCGLWYWRSKDHSDGEITTVRNGSDRSTVQIYLHGSTALHWNATAQNWRGAGIFVLSIKCYIGTCYHLNREQSCCLWLLEAWLLTV